MAAAIDIFGHNSLTDFSEILYEEAERYVDEGYITKTANFYNPRWRTAAIFKIVKSPYLSQKLSDFDEIWYTTSDIEPDYSLVTKKLKFLKFKMAAAAILKVAFFCHNSSTDCPISAKFCLRKQNGMSTRAMTKTANF